MSAFTDYRAQLEEKGTSIDTIPSLKQEDRTLLIRTGVPFFITGARPVTSQFGSQLVYDIQIDVSSPEYISTGRSLEIGSEYVLWAKATTGRLEQLEKVLQPFIDKHKPLIMVKIDSGWDFDEYNG